MGTPENGRPGSALQLIGRSEAGSNPRSTISGRRGAAVGLAGAVLTLGAVAFLNVSGVLGAERDLPASSAPAGEPEARGDYGSHDGPAGLVGPGEPCPDAVILPTELAAIRAVVDVPVWKPTAAPITRAWRCGETPVLMVDGVQVSYESGWSGVDVEKKWLALAADYGGEQATIAGHLALVQDAAKASGDSSQVLLVEGDTLVRFLASAEVPISRMTALAGSLPLG